MHTSSYMNLFSHDHCRKTNLMKSFKKFLAVFCDVAFILGIISKFVDKLFLSDLRAATYQSSIFDSLIAYFVFPCFWFSCGFFITSRIIHFKIPQKLCKVLNVCGAVAAVGYAALCLVLFFTNRGDIAFKMATSSEILIIFGILAGISRK